MCEFCIIFRAAYMLFPLTTGKPIDNRIEPRFPAWLQPRCDGSATATAWRETTFALRLDRGGFEQLELRIPLWCRKNFCLPWMSFEYTLICTLLVSPLPSRSLEWTSARTPNTTVAFGGHDTRASLAPHCLRATIRRPRTRLWSQTSTAATHSCARQQPAIASVHDFPLHTA